MSEPLKPAYEAQIREHVATMSNYSLGNLFARDLLAEIDRLRAELAQAVQHRDHWHAEVMCADARILELQRQIPKGDARGSARLDAKAAADAEATHWRRLGMAEPPRCTCGNAAYEQMYDRRVPCKPNCETKQEGDR